MSFQYTSALPFDASFPAGTAGPVEVMRDMRLASNNATKAGQTIIGTYYGVRVKKLRVVQENAGAMVKTVSDEFFLPTNTPTREGDNLRWLADGTRYKVTKVFMLPKFTIVWGEVMRSL